MADSAFQIQYCQEFIAQFEQGQSWLRNVCTTEAEVAVRERYKPLNKRRYSLTYPYPFQRLH